MDSDPHSGHWPPGPGATPPLRPGPWVPPGSSHPQAPTEPSHLFPPGPPPPPRPPSAPGGSGYPLSGPPTLGSPYAPQGPPPASSRPPRPGRARLGLAVFAISGLVGALGYGLGRWADDRRAAVATSASVVTPNVSPATTAIAPLSGQGVEPIEAVAKVLGPAVVQIETTSGLGSGFVYQQSGGSALIMTASHVTAGASTVTVRLADGNKLDGTVVGEDSSTDVAVVRIHPTAPVTVAALAVGVPIQVGQTAVAIGSPFGLDQTVTAGIVSAVGRSTQTPGGVVPAIQTDAPINHGNSGGALADRQGRVIGINDSIATGTTGSGTDTGNVGVGFAIPIEIAKPVADELVAGKHPQPAFLGIRGANATGSRSGAVVTSVESGSPAQAAGVRTDDVVVGVDSSKVESMVDLAAIVRTRAPGTTVTLTYQRGGKTYTVNVKLGTAPGG